MDQELKSLLTILLGKIDGVGASVGELRGEVGEMRREMTGMKGKMTGMEGEMTGMKGEMAGMKAAIANLEREHTVTRQILGATNQQMIGRLDQLTMQYETLVGARPSAAE